MQLPFHVIYVYFSTCFHFLYCYYEFIITSTYLYLPIYSSRICFEINCFRKI